jgi:hypothetical protein
MAERRESERMGSIVSQLETRMVLRAFQAVVRIRKTRTDAPAPLVLCDKIVPAAWPAFEVWEAHGRRDPLRLGHIRS